MDLVAAIHNSISKEKSEEPRNYIGALSIAEPCRRKLWYGFKGYQGNPIEPKTQITFEIGHKLEEMILEYLTRSGIFVINKGQFYQDSSVLCFQGHVDGVIVLSDESRAILELETANDASFNNFVKHGLLKWSEMYYSQLQSYMGMSGIHKGVLLAINKNTSAMHHEWVGFDELFYQVLRMKANAIALSEDPPGRINNSQFYFHCNMCRYKDICHDGN